MFGYRRFDRVKRLISSDDPVGKRNLCSRRQLSREHGVCIAFRFKSLYEPPPLFCGTGADNPNLVEPTLRRGFDKEGHFGEGNAFGFRV